MAVDVHMRLLIARYSELLYPLKYLSNYVGCCGLAYGVVA